MPEVLEFRDLDRLAGLRPRWDALLKATDRANFFQTFDWLEVYLKHFGATRQLRALAVCEGGQITGIVPLVLRTDRTAIGSIRALAYPLDDWGNFFGPIGPSPTETLEACLNYLRSRPRDWDVLDLRWIEGCELARSATRGALRAAGLGCSERLYYEVGLVDLAGTWAEYLASRSAKFRENLRRAERRAQSAAAIEYVHFRPRGAACGDADPRWDLYSACEQISAVSWQGNFSEGSTLSRPDLQPFFRDAHEAAVRLGCADLHLLKVDSRPAAFLYNYVYAGLVYGLRSGYDPAYRSLSAGTLLLAQALQKSFERGDHTYDLGPEDIAYKQRWATRIVGSYGYSHYPAGDVKAQVLHWGRHLRDWLASAELAVPPASTASAR